jgi:hypothetical protein
MDIGSDGQGWSRELLQENTAKLTAREIINILKSYTVPNTMSGNKLEIIVGVIERKYRL